MEDFVDDIQDAIGDAKKNIHNLVTRDIIVSAGGINDRIAARITNAVGSMWYAYVFAGIAAIALPAAILTKSPIIIVAWIAQTFLQLVLLPIIMVGQNHQAKLDEARAEADHLTINAIHILTGEVHTIHEKQTEILRRLDKGVDKTTQR